MKQELMKRVLIAGVTLLSVPALSFAQQEKEKEKKQMQTIVITREGNTDGKTVIEIEGDKVKVNGKDAKDNKDVNVNINTFSAGEGNVFRMRNSGPGARTWNFDMNEEGMSLFREDENRAMLGVVTEGDEKGAVIRSVTENSAAAKAGLKKGDVITRIGSKKIEDTDDVTEAVRSHKPGDKVEVAYLREGKEGKASAELTKWKGIRMSNVTMPRIHMAPTPPNVDIDMERFENFGGFSTGRPKLGLSIQDTDDGKGVKVLEVDEESNAAKAGIKENDVILSIDDKEVKSTDDITRTIRSSRDKFAYNFKVQRGGKTQNIEVKMPRKLKTADL